MSNNEVEIDKISRKLFLINEKRKLVEKIFEDSIIQINSQKNKKFIIVYENNWHHGVLGIVASKIASLYNKPTFVLSFINDIGSGSGRSINEIDRYYNSWIKNSNIIENGGDINGSWF